MEYTQEQIDAINSKGKVIVSASAGSGKTAVMIKKMIDLILSGVDVSATLAVTFTKKAASQMKEKLKTKLIETINEEDLTEERRKSLKEQLLKVTTADISTIHSFCSTLIRTHFFDADVSGDFKIIAGDDAESVALKDRALDKVFEEAYAEDETGEFFKLLSVYWRKKSDKTFKEIILKIYSKLRDRADYRELLERSGNYSDENFSKIEGELFDFLKKKCEYYAARAEEYEYYFKTHDGEPSAILAGEVKDAFRKIAAAPDFFTATLTEKTQFSTKEKTPKRPKEYVDTLSELIYLRDKKYGEVLKYLAKFRSREDEKKAFFEAGVIARALGRYILKFDDEYSALKREKNLLDYNDLEHVTLKLLQNEKVLKEVNDKYKHVFVDEYQDVNPVQEKIISLVGGQNVFLVGDVKQAIYGFRGSKSRYFGEKQVEFATMGGTSLKLSRNFRSSDAVLDAVNSLFCSVMTKETSDVDYAYDSVMERGGMYPENSGKVVAHILSTDNKEDKKMSKDKESKNVDLSVYSVQEASKNIQKDDLKTARAIKEIIDAELGSDFFDLKDGWRKVDYSDIVVLSRKKQGEIKDVALALSDAGVPISSAAAVNICEYSEVKTLIDILKLLDNEKQDEPLVSALLSPMGKLTADELAQIRIAYSQERFFRDACKRFAVEMKNVIAAKLQKFYTLFAKLRALAAVASVGEVLNELFTQSEMESAILSRENGVVCLKRVRRFVAESVTPEALSLHDFLVRLRNLDYKILYSESGGENSVQILTMHSSKGLEYPVVIVDATGKFRGPERAEVVMDEEYGLATKAYDRVNMIKRSTLLRELYDVKKRRDEVGDELNLYYVALTRAKYAAHVLFKEKPTIKNILYANSFAELTDFSVWEKYLSYGVEEALVKQDRNVEDGPADENLVERIVNANKYQYPYLGVEELPVKSSATSMMDEMETGKTEEYAAYGLFDDQEDEIGNQVKASKTSKEAGVAYHAFLEKFDFNLIPKGAGARDLLFSIVENTLKSWKETGVLPTEQLALLAVEKLTEILLNPVFSSLGGMTLYKEQQFLVSLPIKDIPAFRLRAVAENKNVPLDEELLFQGAIDLLAVGENGETRIIDYKYSIKDERALKEKYAPQLDLYKKATARILKTDVEKIKCSIVNLYRGFEVTFD